MADVSFTVNIQGVQKTLSTLKKLDIQAYNQTIGSIQGVVAKAQSSARVRYPDSGYNTADGQIRGWINKKGANKFPHYNQRQAVAGVKTVVGKRTGKSRYSYRVAALVQRDPGGVIYDMAGSRTDGAGRAGTQFVGLLRTIGGKASRVMWPAVRQNQTAITATIVEATKQAERLTNRELGLY